VIDVEILFPGSYSSWIVFTLSSAIIAMKRKLILNINMTQYWDSDPLLLQCLAHLDWWSFSLIINGFSTLECLQFMFLWAIWKETCDDHSGLRCVFRSNISSITCLGTGCTVWSAEGVEEMSAMCTVLVIKQMPINCVQANDTILELLPHIILYLSTKRYQNIGSPGHVTNSFLKFCFSKNSVFQDKLFSKNRQNSSNFGFAVLHPAPPPYGAAPSHPPRCALAAVVLNNQNRALSLSECEWYIVTISSSLSSSRNPWVVFACHSALISINLQNCSILVLGHLKIRIQITCFTSRGWVWESWLGLKRTSLKLMATEHHHTRCRPSLMPWAC